ncbi:Zinc finger and SCAN domain-containing protein 20 [Anabarilius grahami]|uniref:Zinc finger and SCAN domain-containing protein 20 n=1 Tax=Anabarilius grahami TaxID=495550 RepID=A0A3N0Z373_ANAGA|nr:Zinc finger and SCAN domain-containing protein 20 [Anabarilius grahami]
MVPHLRLLSAAMWQVTEQRQVKHYGMLEEFVIMVTKTVPELLNDHQTSQLILGLRARRLLELCRGQHHVPDLEEIQPHMDRIRAPRVNSELVDEDMGESEACFLDLIRTLISNPEKREHFFQNIFPEEYGPKFDKNLQTLMEVFLLQLDRMISVPDLSQTVSWLRACPSLLEECIHSVSVPKQMKTLLEHHRANGNLQDNESLHSAHNSCTFSSQSLPPLVRVVISSDHTESGDPSESGADLDGQDKDDCHTDPDTSSCTAKKRKFKMETEEREDEEDDDDDDQNWPIAAAQSRGKWNSYDDSSIGEGLNQTHTKKTSKKSSKRKREDTAEVSREFTFINHLGAYTEESSYQTSDASKVPWSEEETFGLIDIWGKDSVQRSLKDCARNRHIFNLISKKMFERGFTRTAEQCHTRIKRLKMSFRQCHENIVRGERPEWKFYNVLEKIICRKDSTEQEDGINDVSIPEESPGQQAEDDTDWDVLGHVGLEGTRNIPWTDLETQTLIRIWGEDKTQRELRGVLQNGHIFAMISKKMAAHGYVRTAEQCQSRVKRLKLCFKQSYESKHTEGKDQVDFKFYKQMERIMANEESCSSQIKEEESTDIEYQVYKYQEIETAMNCMDDRKKVAWSDAETLILLQLWGNEQVQRNLQLCPHNGHIYLEISEKLNAHGYLRSAEQCHTRIKRLKISYRHCRDSISSPEAERIEFKFYDLMEDIFQKNASSRVSGDNEPNNGIKSDSQDTCSRVDQTASWSDSETVALIDIWAEDEVQEALRGSVHNGHVFADIAEKLNSQGFFKSPEQCRWKIKNLTKNFRQCYERKKCGIENVDCKYYDKLEQVLEYQQAALVAVSESGRKMTWSDRETQALLDIWGDDRVQHSLMSCPKNRHIYRYISKRMMALGFNRTGVQCHSRIKRLKSQFYYDGEECKFYDQLEQIILKDRTSDDQDISELESITDSDSDSLALSKPPTVDGPKLAWGDSETHTLISIWGSDHIQERLKGCVKRKPVFQQIALVMAEKGYSRTDEQCRSRIKRLKASYRQCLDNYRNQGEQVEWKFFKQLNKIFEKYPLDETETTTAQEPEAVGRKNPSRSAKAQSSGESEL